MILRLEWHPCGFNNHSLRVQITTYMCPVLNQVTIYLYILLSVTITLPYKEGGGGDREVRMIL